MTSRQTTQRSRSGISRREALQAGGVGIAGLMSGLIRPAHAAAQTATPAATPAAAASSLPAELSLALTQATLQSLAETWTPGAIAGVWMPGQGQWTLAAGLSDITTGQPPAPDDHYRIASTTKTFVATVILQLVDEGDLSLDDTLGQFIEGIPNGDRITLRHLLTMTSGVYNYIYDPLIAVDYEEDPLIAFTPEQVVEIIRAHGAADFAPGEQAVYSDSNYVLLGLIVEQVTGKTIAEEITTRLITPLGLTGTSFATTPDMPEPYLRGYAAGATQAPLRDVTRSNPDVAWAAGAMVSTLADQHTWLTAMLTGDLLSPATQAERLQIIPWVEDPIHAGYGMGVLELGGLQGHSGGILGYSSWSMQEPASGITIVTVANEGSTEGGAGGSLLFMRLADILFPGRGFDRVL
ncbi:MAG: serine hydrolase domain-containing protein [Thermomicrobiales bacterium]